MEYGEFLTNQKKYFDNRKMVELKEANEILKAIEEEREFNKKYYDIFEKKRKEYSSIFFKTPSEFIFNYKYKTDLEIALKGYKTKVENFCFILENENEHIKITDKIDSICCNNDTENFEKQVDIMIKMALSKGWELDEIQINSENQTFTKEAERQINHLKDLKKLDLNSGKEDNAVNKNTKIQRKR